MNLKKLNKNVEYSHFKMETFFTDDTLLMEDSEKECVQNVKSSLALFKSLGFAVHTVKSFPPFSIIPSTLHKLYQGQSKRDIGYPRLAQSAMVPNTGKETNAKTHPHANKPRSKTQTAKGSTFDYMQSIRKRLKSSDFPQTASSVICSSSWHSGQYTTYIAKWKRYANKQVFIPFIVCE